MALGVVAERRSSVVSGEHAASSPQARTKVDRLSQHGWLIAALAITLVFTWRSMSPVLDSRDSVQDDARQHVFWLARLRDPELFPNDLIADYFQALAPPGYVALYWALSHVVDPLLASKLLPPLLGLTAALFTFLFVRRLHPSLTAAFLATTLASWYLWQYDDLVTATPRAFTPPLLAMQLWALAAGRSALGAGLAVLAAALYPVAGALMVGCLGASLVGWRGRLPCLSREPARWGWFLGATVLAVLVVLPSQLAAVPFGPALSAAEARLMPDFGQRGRFPFFVDDPYWYWVFSQNSGLDLRFPLPFAPDVPALFGLLAVSLPLPLLLLARRYVDVGRLSGQAALLPQVLLASFGLFFVAHLLLFQLYVPSRYVKWSVPLVLAVAGGLTLGLLLDAAGRRLAPRRASLLVGALVLGLAVGLAAAPARFFANFKYDNHPAVTDYLRAQPKEIIVAAAPLEADSLTTFARRRVLTDREHVYAWHLGYFGEMHRRTEELIAAYYAETSDELVDFAARHGVDLFLVNRSAFDPLVFGDVWSGFPRGRWEPYTPMIAERLLTGQPFALLESVGQCAVVDDGEVAVVPTSCLHAAR